MPFDSARIIGSKDTTLQSWTQKKRTASSPLPGSFDFHRDILQSQQGTERRIILEDMHPSTVFNNGVLQEFHLLQEGSLESDTALDGLPGQGTLIHLLFQSAQDQISLDYGTQVQIVEIPDYGSFVRVAFDRGLVGDNFWDISKASWCQKGIVHDGQVVYRL